MSKYVGDTSQHHITIFQNDGKSKSLVGVSDFKLVYFRYRYQCLLYGKLGQGSVMG
jgi:hypothetical protein